MERELLLTGVGGQGVQLAAQLVARAAVADGRQAMLFGSYGGMMRGGNTDATIVIADGPILAPPTVPSAWSAIVMHHEFCGFVRDRLRPGTVVLLNTSVFQGSLLDGSTARVADADPKVRIVEVSATAIAQGAGAVVAATVVMVGALAALTGLVSLDSLVDAVPACLPSYRMQHIDLNINALHAGFATLEGHAPVSAWSIASVGAAT